MEQNNAIILFQEKQVRRIWHEGEWWFSIIDVIQILTETGNPQSYWGKLKEREPQLLTICQKMKFVAPDGKMRPTDCANTEGMFRILMSVPSPKVEPFKLWLASVGKERLEEYDDPSIAVERAREIYKLKGYPAEWIETRIKSIDIRKQLTDEWKLRGVKEGQEFSILTATISKGTFGLTPTEHKDLKGLEKENLRDHMTGLELIFTMLGEEITRSKANEIDAQGFNENYDAATEGGRIAGAARERVEKEGQKVISTDNFKQLDTSKDTNDLPPQ